MKRRKPERPGKEQFCRPAEFDFRHCATKTTLKNTKKVKPKYVTKQSALRIDKKFCAFKSSSSDLECGRKSPRTIKISNLGFSKAKKKIASGQTKIYSTPPNAPMKKDTPKTTTYTCTTEPLIVLKSSEFDLASGIDRIVQLQDIIHPPSDFSATINEKAREVAPQTDIFKQKIDQVLDFEDFIPKSVEANTKAIGLVDVDNIRRTHPGLDKEVIQRFRQGIASFTDIENYLPLDGVFREDLRTEKPKCKEKPKNETDLKEKRFRDQSKLPTASKTNILKQEKPEKPEKKSFTKITVNRSQAMSRVSSTSIPSKDVEPERSSWNPQNWTTNQIITFGILIAILLAVLGLYSRADFDYDD